MENNLIQIKEYAKPKKGEGGSGGKITYNINGADIGSSLKLKSLQANRILSDYIESNTVKAGTGDFVYLVASDGTISTLRGDNLDYSGGHIGDLTADSIETDKLKVNDTATIKNIFNDYLSSREIVTDYLTVNKAAHFFEVVIDKIRSVGGTIINTATNCVIDYVEPVIEGGITTGYKCYWKQTNNEDDYVSNDWMPNDQAISQNCNLVAGVNHNTGNHYYWRLVKEVSNTTTYVNFETGETSPGVLVDGVTVAPEYKVTFVPFPETDYIFKYDNGQDDEEGSFPVTVTDWNITAQTYVEQPETEEEPEETEETEEETEETDAIADDWDSINNILTVRDTLHGLQLIPNNYEIVINEGEANEQTQEKYPNIRRGHFTFTTEQLTRLNVMIMFDNDTIEYHPTTGPATAYDIEIVNPNNAIVTMIVITSDVVDVWHACHWVILGNGQGEVDNPTGSFGTEVSGWDNIPAKGDNIAQLGYRYQNLSGYVNSKAWRDAHKDEVSRASAIIIAAYKTPDSGGTINGKTIAPIMPPSYAQYQNIIDFDLSTHRGTYMDATGTYIKGNLISESGDTTITVDDLLEISSTYYRLICNENPIVRTDDPNQTVRFTVFKVEDGIGEEMDFTQVLHWTITVNGGSPIEPVEDENYFEVQIGSSDTIEVNLLDPDDNIKDTYVGSIINFDDVQDGKDGKDGKYNQWAYKTSTVANIGSRPTSNSTYPPTGWQSTPQSISNEGEHIWMITRTVDPSLSNPYGSWSWPATRIDGEDGVNGTDGDFIEFIYTRNDTGTAPSAPPTSGTYPRDWPNNGTTDHQTDGNGVTWWDNPKGVTESMMYEYVSSREYNGASETWTDYSQPALWSKYGENGMDGDGVEYIFCLTADENHVPELWQTQNDFNAQEGTYYSPGKFANVEYSNSKITRWRGGTKGSNYSNTAEWHDASLSEYLPPNNQLGYVTSAQTGVPVSTWTDDPQGVSSQYKVEWVSQRKYDGRNKEWGDFSEPSIWAKYSVGTQGPAGPQGSGGTQGPTGPQGSNGQNGNDGEFFELVPIREVFEVRLNGDNVGATAYTNINGDLYMDLIYAIAHIKGNTVTYLNLSEIQQYGLNINSDNTQGQNNYNFRYTNINDQSRYQTVSIYNNDDNGAVVKSYDAIRIEIPNYLTWINNTSPTNTNYNNYYYLHDNNLTAWMPTRLTVRLFKNSGVYPEMDATNVDLIFKPSHIFSVTDSALNSIYQGLSGTQGSWNTTGFSNIKQTWDNINLSVNNIQSLEYGENIDSTKNINSPGLEQFALYRSTSDTAPSAPNSVSSTSNNVNGTWTLNTTLPPTTTYKYVYISKRTRSYNVSTGNYNSWSGWSTPSLYWVYGVPRSMINSAKLTIEADKIESKVTKSVRTSTNLIMNGAFMFDDNYWSKWGNPSTYNIYTDSDGYKWGHVKNNIYDHNGMWQGYYQKHNEDYNITIEGGKTYTLSYKAYCSQATSDSKKQLQVCFHWGNNTELYKQFRNSSELASHGIPQINLYKYIDDTPQTYEHTFVVKQDTYGNHTNNTNDIYVYDGSDWVSTGSPVEWFEFMIGGAETSSYDFYVTDIMLTPGDVARAWSPCAAEVTEPVGSLISQTADEILMQVGDCGIDITNNRIELNGSTQINGNLRIENADTGFVIHGPQGDTYITSESIGSFENFRNDNTNTTQESVTRTAPGPSYRARAYYEFQLPAGKEITFSDINVTINYPHTGAGQCTYWSMQLQRRTEGGDWSNVGLQITNTSTLTDGAWKYTTANGQYFYQMVLDWTISNITTNIGVRSTFKFKTSYPGELKTLIAYDGIASNLADGTVYIGQSGTYIQYGNYGLKVTNSGIYKHNSSGWTLANL